MNMAVRRKIGVALILGIIAASGIAALARQLNRPEIEFIPFTSRNGPLGLGIVLNAAAWRYAVADSRLPAERAVRLPVSRERLSAIVAKGVQLDHLEAVCRDGWSLVQLNPISDGSMFVSCYCTNTDPMRTAENQEDQ